LWYPSPFLTVSDEADVQIQYPSTSLASKKKNPLEETVGETHLVEPKGIFLVEPKGKCTGRIHYFLDFPSKDIKLPLPWMM
jgi:hypothetical protein